MWVGVELGGWGGTTRIPESPSCLLTRVEHRYLVEDLESVCRFLDGAYQLMSLRCKIRYLLTNNGISTDRMSTQRHSLVSSIAPRTPPLDDRLPITVWPTSPVSRREEGPSEASGKFRSAGSNYLRDPSWDF